MKQRFLLQSLACLLVVSCSVQEIEIKDTESSKGDIFYASLESFSDPETRVYLDETIKILWDQNDPISIFNKTTRNQQYEFTGNTGDNAGSFKEVTNAATNPPSPGEPLAFICAVYPYQNSTNINREGVMTLTLPEIQTYREGSFGPGANTMVSATEDNLLKFKNVGGYLALQLYGEGVSISSIKLEGNNDELLSGKANLTPAVGSHPIIAMEKTAGKSITLKCDKPVELKSKKEDATQFWMVVPPTDFTKGITMTVTDSDGNEIVKSTPVSLSIARNGVLRISPVRIVTVPIKYSKTSTLSVGSTYLVVDVSDERLFLGATDGSYKEISPENGIITDTDGSLAGYEFTVENEGNNYFLKFNDGRYLVCDYTNNSGAGLAYVDTPSDVKYPYALTTGNNGAFFFNTTNIQNGASDQVLYYRIPGGDNTDRFKIGGTGKGVGVHLYMKGGKLDRDLGFNPTSVTCFVDETPVKPALSGTYTTVSYTSSDESIAKVNANGDVTVFKNGTVTITASVEEDDLYNAASATYTLIIKKHKTTIQYERVTSADQINTDGEYVIVYDDGVTPKVFKPVLNANKTAFMTTNNAADVTIDDDEIEASEVDGYRIQLTNRQNDKFALLIPEADGLTDYYLVVYMSSSIFVASTTEANYRTAFTLSPQGELTMLGNSSNYFKYATNSFTASSGNSTNLYLFVRNGGPVKQRQYPYFAESTVTWAVGENYEIGGSYDPQPVLDAYSTVTYSAEPESVAKVENGKIKIMGAGTATITATASKSDNYFTASASYTLRIRNTAGGWVDLGNFNLENEALNKYLNEAEQDYTDTNDDTYTVMDKYSGTNYYYIDRKDCPAPVRITWTDEATRNTVISIFNDKSLGKPIWTQNASEKATTADVYNLIPGRTYYYTVSENDDIWEKGCFSTSGRRRMLKVSDTEAKGRANNCRDLGGLEVMDNGVKKTIQYGLLFRGSCMDATTDAEKDFIVGFMNVGLDVDLRGDGTSSSPGGDNGNTNCYRAFSDKYNVAYNSQQFASGQTIDDLTTPEKVKSVLTDIFQTVKKGKSVYFHCHIGADRTGYMAMLIEGLLGVSEKDISIDYELTSFSDAAGQRFRNGKPVWYTFRSGIAYLREQPGTTFQNKIENYLVNTVEMDPDEIKAFKNLVLGDK